MKDLRVETVLGGIFILSECTAFGANAIMHRTSDEILDIYEIQDGDKITEVK